MKILSNSTSPNRLQKSIFIILIICAGLLFLLWPPTTQEEVGLPYAESVQATGRVVEVPLIAGDNLLSLSPDIKISTWSYNGTVPGPEIRINKGDTLRIPFTNRLPQATTIHFHGIRVPNAMDGIPGVTQDPIQPGESFTYEFTPKDAGTFWYHPHVRSSEQVERGLYGVIVVEDPSEPPYDQDQVIVLDDWRLNQLGNLNEQFNTPHDLMHDGRWGNFITVNGQPDFNISATAGDRLRLRIVNTSNGRVYRLDFGDLEVQGIAVDGMLSQKPFAAQLFEVAPGNRLDVDVTIPTNSQKNQYIIRDTFTREPNKLLTITINELDNLPTSPSSFSPPSATIFPDWTNSKDVKIDQEYRLNARRGGEYGIEWTINGLAYPEYQPITLKKEKLNVIRFINQSSRLHPMHLHGQFFKVLSRNGQNSNEPFLRDTVLIKPQETIVIGLVPLDEGTWANHCHILEHAEAGMMTLVKVE